MNYKFVVYGFGNEVTVIGNTGSNSTREAVHATEQGFAVSLKGSAVAANLLSVRMTMTLVVGSPRASAIRRLACMLRYRSTHIMGRLHMMG